MFGNSGSDTTENIFTNSFFKEIGLALQQDYFYLFKRVGDIEQFRLMQTHKEMVSHNLNVLGHLIRVHTNQRHRKGLFDEISFNFYSTRNDMMYNHWHVEEMFIVDMDNKVMVKALSWEISPLAKERLGRSPCFLSQKTAQKAPEKKMP